MSKPLWMQFYEMTKEQAEAERARERARMQSGEMTEAEAIERLDAWEKAGEMWRADLTMARKMAGLARATGHPKGTPVMPWLIEQGLLIKIDEGSRFDSYRFTERARPHLVNKPAGEQR
jgi:hypothetical protein